MRNLISDVKYGIRVLAKTPAFTLVAIAALAIGIGANITIFGFANALLFEPLPVAEPDQVVRMFNFRAANVRYPEYLEYRDRNQSLQGLAGFMVAEFTTRADGPPQQITGTLVTGNYFATLGVPAAIGRAILPDDDRSGAPGVVVLTDSYWRARFNGNPGVLGQTMAIDGSPFTIVGVTPASFTGINAPLRPEIFVAWNAPHGNPPSSAWVAGRLKPGISVEQTQADMSRIASQLAQEENREVAVTVYPGHTLNPDFMTPVTLFMGVLMAVTSLILLVACANIASLLLARSAARRREMGIRVALGANRAQLIRQLLTESALLSIAGGVVAAAIAVMTARAIQSIALPVPVPIGLEFTLDWRVLAFGIGTALATTLFFGLVPALQAAKKDVLPSLKEGSATSTVQRSRWRAGFIVAQVAMSTLLLVTAALLLRSLTSPQATSRGFVSENVLVASLRLSGAGYTPERGADFYENLIRRLEDSPGVVSANVVTTVPLTLGNSRMRFHSEGVEPGPEGQNTVPVNLNDVSRGHFRTLGIPLLQGRDFSYADRDQEVGIVNETLARRMWPGENPIGKRLRSVPGGPDPWVEVVGVVADSKYASIGEELPAFLYRPLGSYAGIASVLIKTEGDPLNAQPILRAAVESLDAEIPIFNITTLDDATSISLLPVQIAAGLASSLGAVALALGAIGIYGVMSYLVRQRTREIGIRMALGALPSDVVRMMTRESMRWTGAGLGLGLLAALALTRLLTSLLYGVGATDALAFAAISILLAATAYAACWIPARRATHIDPLTALREE